ncbi:MAG: glycoside hydrolase family 3 N-terminal domain-containing protein, partial [Candidatus Nanopelagicales bacterium]
MRERRHATPDGEGRYGRDIVLLGNDAPSDLRRQLTRVERAAPQGHEPLIASDEEGGSVQRLDSVIRPLPSAETMGNWPVAKLQRVAAKYGRGMAQLGVLMSLAPVADLRVPGSYMKQTIWGDPSGPVRAMWARTSWRGARGLCRESGVAPVVKHWPGHGHARDTHQFAARVRDPRPTEERADMVPFEDAFAAGVPAVMVAHVQSRGLTPNGVPATQSRKAISVLRGQAGPDTVIITDSLSIGGGIVRAGADRGPGHRRLLACRCRLGDDLLDRSDRSRQGRQARDRPRNARSGSTAAVLRSHQGAEGLADL